MKFTEEEIARWTQEDSQQHECLVLQQMIRQLREERDALRKQVELWHQWERERWFKKAGKVFGPRMEWKK